MNIEQGILVKTLSSSIVKTQNQKEPCYWFCNDGRTYLTATLREVSKDEHDQYVVSHIDP
jgi:hypothetical protein